MRRVKKQGDYRYFWIITPDRYEILIEKKMKITLSGGIFNKPIIKKLHMITCSELLNTAFRIVAFKPCVW
jgi:hypothetical protein